jgi:hypothetical protein
VRLVKVVGERPGVVLVPPVSLKLDLEAPLEKKAGVGAAKKAGVGAAFRRADRPADATTTSWWTARATAGEVRPGFTKEEILRKPEADPRAEGGMFSRLEGLLAALG